MLALDCWTGVQKYFPFVRFYAEAWRTEKEIYGVWGMVGCIEQYEVVVSCPHVAEVVVLVCPHFPSLWYILPHDVLMSVWNDGFMTSCSNGCGAGMPSFPVSPKYTLLISHMVSSYSSFYDVVLYTTVVQIRAQYFSQLKTVGRAETFESWSSEKGANSKSRTKIKHTLGW